MNVGRAAVAVQCIIDNLQDEGVTDERHGLDTEEHRRYREAMTDSLREAGALHDRDGAQ